MDNNKKKVIFDGAYGISSFGDDAPLIVMVDMLRKKIGNIEFVVVSRHPEEDHYSNYGIKSIRGLEYPTKEESIGKWFRGFNPDDDKSDLYQLYKEVESSDLLILGAGNYLVDYTIDILKGPVPRFVIMTIMAKMAGTPIMWYGISVGPLKTKLGRDLSRFAASLATIITVRDTKSILELSNIGVKASAIELPDAVYKFTSPEKGHAKKFSTWVEAHTSDRPVIVISARSLPDGCGIDNETYLLSLANLCDLLIDRLNANILFIPQCTYTHGNLNEDDRNIAKDIITKMQHTTNVYDINESIDVFDCISLYEGALGAICTRLHGNVFAVMQGVPVIGLNYNPKVFEFFHWLGYEDLVVEITDINPNLLYQKLITIITHRHDFVKYSQKRLDDGKFSIEKYADLALEAMKYKVKYPNPSE